DRAGRWSSVPRAGDCADRLVEPRPRDDRVPGQRQDRLEAAPELSPARRRRRLLGRRVNLVNLYDVETKQDEKDPPGYETPYNRLGPSIGASALGLTVYELRAGQSVCPYHYEYGREEWLFVLTGRPTLRAPDGEHELEAGDLV